MGVATYLLAVAACSGSHDGDPDAAIIEDAGMEPDRAPTCPVGRLELVLEAPTGEVWETDCAPLDFGGVRIGRDWRNGCRHTGTGAIAMDEGGIVMLLMAAGFGENAGVWMDWAGIRTQSGPFCNPGETCFYAAADPYRCDFEVITPADDMGEIMHLRLASPCTVYRVPADPLGRFETVTATHAEVIGPVVLDECVRPPP